MNLDRARLLLSKLPVKHRELNTSVPFILNPNQLKAHAMIKEHYAKHGSIRVIILKARRVGMSSYVDGLAVAHCLARSQAHAMIVAHLKEVADKGLFRVPRDMSVALNEQFPGTCEVQAKNIRFHHSDGESNLDIATAGSVGAGRGMTLTYLHLSECAQYPGSGSFLSILPAVAKAPDTVIALESTAQGRDGIGETFYEYWNSAKMTGAKWNGYTPIFLSWLDDPGCHRQGHEADDAPASDLERELMAKPFYAKKSQIAWMRMVLEGECRGSELMFGQEYPWEDQVAFVATGDPAFTSAEIRYATSTKMNPIKKGRFIREGKGAKFIEDKKGKWLIYEDVRPKCEYYAGNDCARGIEAETGRASGDFSATVILNGTTGDVAARFADWVDPVAMAVEVDAAGRYFNNAMMIIELTGNLGLWLQKELRDIYHYPNWYIWKGKDDRQRETARNSVGWETNGRTRDLLMATFRAKLRDGMMGVPGGLAVRDEELIRQMDRMTMATGMRFEIEHGHDDVFFAAAMAVIACAQWPPSNIASYRANVLEKDKNGNPGMNYLKPQENLLTALKRDLRFVFRGQGTHENKGRAPVSTGI